MHILIEHILTGSTNRPLYESLWNLSVSKTVKPNQKFLSENQNVAVICNQIIQEIHRDDPDRNNFYYSTQIAFGCLILYRHQIDKLYNQTKNALQSCTATFFEINWLTQMAQHAPKKERPKAGVNKKKQNEPNSSKKGKPAQTNVVEMDCDFDLLEDIFRIEQSPVAKKAGKGQKQLQQDLDPTMAISTHQITIIEAKPTDFVRSYNMKQEMAEGDFGDDFGANDKQLDLSFHILVPQQTNDCKNIESMHPMELDDIPDMLRCTNAISRELPLTLPSTSPREDKPVGLHEQNKSRKRKASVQHPAACEEANISQRGNYPELPLTLPEESLCDDIMDIVSKQMKSRKRRASVDLSTRVEASKGLRLEEPEGFGAEINNDLADPIEVGCAGEPLVPMASSTPKNGSKMSLLDADNSEGNFVHISPIAPISRVPKKRAQKRKLCVDKVTKIPADALTQRTLYYQEHSMLPTPLESFEATFFRIKVSNEPYLTSPSSVLKHGADALLFVFNRNLKRVPNASKRKLPDSDQPKPAATPVKKFRSSRKSVIEDVLAPSVDAIELPTTSDPLEVPSLDELAPMIPVPDLLPEIEFAQEPEIEFAQAPEVAVSKPAKKAQGSSFKESEKWSKAKIMQTLKSLWKQKVTSVTMITLCPNSNRFVAAGVFFELMELSKLGAVELVQGEGLQLANVKPGSNAKAFK